jgi:adenylate cyclase
VVRWIPLIIKCGIVQELKGLNKRRVSQCKQPLDIGINTNPMVVGNMEWEELFDYTIMAGSANLGSRLEGANKKYKTSIIISELTYERMKDKFVSMELDPVRVKGKTEPTKICNLVERDLHDEQERM